MKIRKLLSVGLVALLFSACSEQEEIVANGDDGFCTISLDAGRSVEVDTRAVSGNEDVINNVWVVQLNADGTAALVPPQYFASVTDSKIKVKLKKEQSTVHLLVNTGKADLFDPAAALSTFTTAAVTGKQLTATGDWNTALTHMAMYGTLTGTPGSKAAADLTRALAKVNITVVNSTSGKLSISSMQLKNVPNVQYIATPSGTYPAATGTYLNYTSITTNFTNTYTWYVSENCRGTGVGRYETEKAAANVTAGSYAMYYEIKGKYDGLNVVYTFYLGGNNTNNYNVVRNTNYTMTITISGVNEADARVVIDATKLSVTSNTGGSFSDGGSETVIGTM